MTNQKERFTPFEGELKPETVDYVHIDEVQKEESETLRNLEKHPGKIIREQERRFTDSSKESELLKREKQLFLEMEQYGFRIPHFNAVLGQNKDGESKVFLIIDRVEGKELKKFHLTGEYPSGLDECLAGVLSYEINALQQQRTLYTDLGVHQFVYGHEYGKSDQPNEYYMVDVEPDLFIDPSSPEYYTTFLESTNAFIREVKMLKEKEPDWDWSKTKKKSAELMLLWKSRIKELQGQPDRFFMPSDTLLERLVKVRDLYTTMVPDKEVEGAFVKDIHWLQARKFIMIGIGKEQITDRKIISEYEEKWENAIFRNQDNLPQYIEEMEKFVDSIISYLQQHGV